MVFNQSMNIGLLNAGGRQNRMVAVTGCVGQLVTIPINFAKWHSQPRRYQNCMCRSDIEHSINKERRKLSTISTMLQFGSSNSFPLQRHTEFTHQERLCTTLFKRVEWGRHQEIRNTAVGYHQQLSKSTENKKYSKY